MNLKLLVFSVAALTASGLQAQKLSPNAEALLLKHYEHIADPKPVFRAMSVTDTVAPESVKVFVEMNSADAADSIAALGGRVYQTFGNYAVASVPVEALRRVSEVKAVNYVEMGGPVHLCNDVARELSGIDDIHNNSKGEFEQGYTGKGIVVGVIDTGLDYNHITFRDSDGKLRIKRVWDQNSRGKAPSAFGYGAEYASEDEIRAAGTDDRSMYHGSHTTGIAAGSDRKSAYYGMAPDAEIVFVSFGQNSVDIPNAVKYIFDYAESVGKPCVINMSLGSHLGPHDGTSTLDKYFASVAGPGRLLVGSVGNEGQSKMHISKTFTASSTQLKTILQIPSGSNKNNAVDIWGTPGSEFTVQVVLTDSKGKVVESSEVISSTSTQRVTKSFTDENFDGYCYIIPSNNTENGAPNVYIECYVQTIGDTRNLGFIVTGSDGNYVNMWNLAQTDFVSGGFRGWSAGDNTSTAGEIGGTGEAVISVGSYNSRFAFPCYAKNPDALYIVEAYGPDVIPQGEVSFFSSCGPTTDGRLKPDVLAPGALVISAINGYGGEVATYPDEMVARTLDSTGKYHYYYLNIGTSMAAPVVTGGLALWLEADPTVTPERVREAIAATSRTDEFTGSEPSNTAGYGKFDAYSGLNYILKNYSSISSVDSDDNAERAWAEAGKTICVAAQTPTAVEVYSVLGMRMGRYEAGAGIQRLDASQLPAGIYILRFATSGKAVKIAVR